jgi:predicted nucleic-acid-binding protein
VTALDTNVLVRFLVEDDKAQSARAAKLVERTVAAGRSLFVSDVVLCEVVWVLASCYRVSTSEIVGTLRRLLHAKHLAFDAPDRLAAALDAFEQGRGDFADYLIREHARSAGFDEVATFDRALLKEPGFVEP